MPQRLNRQISHCTSSSHKINLSLAQFREIFTLIDRPANSGGYFCNFSSNMKKCDGQLLWWKGQLGCCHGAIQFPLENSSLFFSNSMSANFFHGRSIDRRKKQRGDRRILPLDDGHHSLCSLHPLGLGIWPAAAENDGRYELWLFIRWNFSKLPLFVSRSKG